MLNVELTVCPPLLSPVDAEPEPEDPEDDDEAKQKGIEQCNMTYEDNTRTSRH